MAKDLSKLPEGLPIPVDDGACRHLHHAKLPSIAVKTTQQPSLDLSTLKGWVVIYCYPMIGRPDKPIPAEWHWNNIPGARGCTPQSCAFRDHADQLAALGAQVFGLSAQSTTDQLEAIERLHLPYPLISDTKLAFTHALNLPTFNVGDLTLNKRVTLIAYNGVIQHYFFPVFPPDKNAEHVIEWLKQHV